MPVLNGYRVLDLSIAMAGPLAAMRLGDLGADVIKIEPTSGEWQRHTSAGGAQGHEVNASFLSLNRNKRSLAVNLKSEADGFRRRDEISRIVTRQLATRDTAHWLRLLGEHGVWVRPVNSYDDLLDDPQVRHNGSFITYEHPTEGTVTTPGFAFAMSATPPAVTRPAPTAGQHTVELLAELGVAAERIDQLVADGVVRAR